MIRKTLLVAVPIAVLASVMLAVLAYVSLIRYGDLLSWLSLTAGIVGLLSAAVTGYCLLVVESRAKR